MDEKYFVIQPPSLVMDPGFSRIHALTLTDIENAPKFDEVMSFERMLGSGVDLGLHDYFEHPIFRN